MTEPTDMAALAALTIDDFSARVGEHFRLEDAPTDAELVLIECEPGGQGLERQAFSLRFLGPADPVLVQRIYRLRHAELGILQLFLVPLGRDAGGTRYEAVFT